MKIWYVHLTVCYFCVPTVNLHSTHHMHACTHIQTHKQTYTQMRTEIQNCIKEEIHSDQLRKAGPLQYIPVDKSLFDVNSITALEAAEVAVQVKPIKK